MIDVFFDTDPVSLSSRVKNAISREVMGEIVILRLKSVEIEQAKILDISEMNAILCVKLQIQYSQYSPY